MILSDHLKVKLETTDVATTQLLTPTVVVVVVATETTTIATETTTTATETSTIKTTTVLLPIPIRITTTLDT